MNPPEQLKQFASTIASTTGYPLPLRWLINASPVDVSLSLERDATIARRARVEGHLEMEEGAKVESKANIVGSALLKKNARVGPDSTLRGDVTVGPWSNFVREIEAIGEITIGGYGAFARRVTFQEKNHNTSWAGTQMRFYDNVVGESLPHVTNGPIRVGNDVWIGADVTILSGVKIGHGAIIGARSVVTKDVSPYEVVAGVPATHRKWRFDEQTREQLLDLAWWEWSDEKIANNKEFFTTDLTPVEDITSLVR